MLARRPVTATSTGVLLADVMLRTVIDWTRGFRTGATMRRRRQTHAHSENSWQGRSQGRCARQILHDKGADGKFRKDDDLKGMYLRWTFDYIRLEKINMIREEDLSSTDSVWRIWILEKYAKMTEKESVRRRKWTSIKVTMRSWIDTGRLRGTSTSRATSTDPTTLRSCSNRKRMLFRMDMRKQLTSVRRSAVRGSVPIQRDVYACVSRQCCVHCSVLKFCCGMIDLRWALVTVVCGSTTIIWIFDSSKNMTWSSIHWRSSPDESVSRKEFELNSISFTRWYRDVEILDESGIMTYDE